MRYIALFAVIAGCSSASVGAPVTHDTGSQTGIDAGADAAEAGADVADAATETEPMPPVMSHETACAAGQAWAWCVSLTDASRRGCVEYTTAADLVAARAACDGEWSHTPCIHSSDQCVCALPDACKDVPHAYAKTIYYGSDVNVGDCDLLCTELGGHRVI